ncbi:MAG: DUF1697 domain-containing protein [Paludibacter sp.]
MKTWISIVRGINVGGRNAIKMIDLRDLFIQLGFSDVRSYIQSGNIIFDSNLIDSKSIEKSISEGILKRFGFAVQIVLLDEETLREILKNNPFSHDSFRDKACMHITFLSENPDKSLIDKIIDGNYGSDEFYCKNKVIYLYCPKGYGNTKLSNSFFENKLKLTATTRNLKTATEILLMSDTKSGSHSLQ